MCNCESCQSKIDFLEEQIKYLYAVMDIQWESQSDQPEPSKPPTQRIVVGESIKSEEKIRLG